MKNSQFFVIPAAPGTFELAPNDDGTLERWAPVLAWHIESWQDAEGDTHTFTMPVVEGLGSPRFVEYPTGHVSELGDAFWTSVAFANTDSQKAARRKKQ